MRSHHRPSAASLLSSPLQTPVRVRVAPSPTGPLHVGTARTALLNFLFARQHRSGAFVLRIEDTDQKRSKPEFEDEIKAGLAWLGLTWDEGPDARGPFGPYRQSERLPLYENAIEKLLLEGSAYEKDGAVIFRVLPRDPLIVHDLVLGDVRFPQDQLTDFVIAKPATGDAERRLTGGGKWVPLFHLAVVVDDAHMEITHVIRGEDHLSNTPKHILLQKALGMPSPAYAHLPLLLDAQRHKLSKRTATTSLLMYREQGYVPEAMVNFLALLGWNPKTADEVFTMPELIARFDLSGVQKGGAVFDLKKLDWVQRQHLRRLPTETLVERAQPYLKAPALQNIGRSLLERALTVWKDRGGLLSEFPEAARRYVEDPKLTKEELPWRGTTTEQAHEALQFAENILRDFPDATWGHPQDIQMALRDAVDQEGRDRGTVLWPVRYALSGQRESPGPGEIAWVLGKEDTLRRIRHAREMLQ